jgi:release factor glutamine methyltransferase
MRCKRLELYVKFDQALTEKQLAAMRRGVKRLAEGEPVQYIIGSTEFMGHSFKVDDRALIPRPETELLVQEVLAAESVWQSGEPTVADIGTGSGCIVISLASAKPHARYLALDTSSDALEIAAENAERLGVLARITFAGSDISESLEPDMLDAVTANLPYIPTAEWEKLPEHIRKHEPRGALDGGEDGLDQLREVVPDAWFVLKPYGKLFLEIGHNQAEQVLCLLEESGFVDPSVKQDLAGHDRVVIAAKPDEG